MKELIIKARENENDMLRLINAFEPLIKKCIKLYVKNFDFYEDAMQHGKIAVIQCVKKYDINSSFPFQAYVKKGVYYSMRDFGRKLLINDLSLDNEIDDDGTTLSDFVEGGEKTEDILLQKEGLKKLHDAIDSLSDKQRKIIIEVYFNNKTMKEVSKNRRCHYMSIVAVKERALKKIRESMER